MFEPISFVKVQIVIGEKEYIIDYADFEGDGDFSDVGAIELQFDGDKQIDVQFSFFGVVGPE